MKLTPLKPADTLVLLQAFNASPRTVGAWLGDYQIVYISFANSSYWRSRSRSIYLRKKYARSIIRISDHWSASKYPRSRKLNCGGIGAHGYKWECFGERVSHHLPGEKYASQMIGGTMPAKYYNALEH